MRSFWIGFLLVAWMASAFYFVEAVILKQPDGLKMAVVGAGSALLGFGLRALIDLMKSRRKEA